MDNSPAEPISKEQIKIIHTLISKMGMSDRVYRQRLGRLGLKSCKEMTFKQAKGFINALQIACNKKLGKTYAGRSYGEERISAAQMGMIRAMWYEVSYLEDPAAREAGLNALVKRLYKVDFLNWLPRRDVEKLRKTIEVMKANLPAKQDGEAAEELTHSTTFEPAF